MRSVFLLIRILKNIVLFDVFYSYKFLNELFY